jgi:hypothetical protein
MPINLFPDRPRWPFALVGMVDALREYTRCLLDQADDMHAVAAEELYWGRSLEKYNEALKERDEFVGAEIRPLQELLHELESYDPGLFIPGGQIS